MNNSKFGRFILLGALVGALASMLDRATREQTVQKAKGLAIEAKYYAKNRDALMDKINQQKEKYQSVYEQLSGDAKFIKQQVEELKTLTPQVKEVVMSTKDAVMDSTEDVKEIVQGDAETAAKK